MKRYLLAAVVTLGLFSARAMAEGELHIYNWTDYTAPDLVKKFQKETGIKVSIDTYDSNETLLAKLKAGGTGYDLVVPSQHFVKILIHEKLLRKVNVKSLPNYRNVAKRWKNPPWDPQQQYTVPWHWGSTSFAYRTSTYHGPGKSLKEFFEPAEELRGRLQVFEAPEEIVNMANLYLGIPFCSEDPKQMRRVRDLLLKQKPYVLTYNSESMSDRLASGATLMTAHWNGDALKGRLDSVPDQVYAYPKEGVVGWFDSLAVPVGAKNVENAKKFMNFVMDPKNIAIQSNYVRYANAIPASDPYIDPKMRGAPELNAPKGVPVKFGEACSPKAQKLISKVCTKVMQ